MLVYHWYDQQPIQLPDGLEIAQFDILENKTAETEFHFTTGEARFEKNNQTILKEMKQFWIFSL